MQIERLIEINEDHQTARNFALDLRNPKTGVHAQAVESKVNEECWNVRLVINLTDMELDIRKTYSELASVRHDKHYFDGGLV